MRYQKIESKIWNDEKFITLTAMQQRLFFYILTSPHNNLVGMYVLKAGYACADLDISTKDFTKDLKCLCDNELIQYDKTLKVLFIINFLRHNPITNPNQKKAAVKLLNNLPRTKLIQVFTDTYEGLSKELINDLGLVLLKPETETEAVTEEEAVTGTEIVGQEKNNIYTQIIEYLNQTVGTRYRPSSQKTQALMQARINEGYTVEDFKRVVDNKYAEWGSDTKYSIYLRPETLFGTKFESYLNQPVVQKQMGTTKTQGNWDIAQRRREERENADNR